MNSILKKANCFLLLFVAAITWPCFGQNTFQRFYNAGADAECFGAYQLNDGGYIFTGIVNSGPYKVFMARTDCDGDVVWCRTFNNSSTVGNISQRAIPTYDGGFVLAASIGSFGSYNILVAKTDGGGNVLWQKVMQGSGDDLVNSVIETKKHELVITGKTNSFGQDAGSNYCDVFIAKLDEYGTFLWGKSYGTYHNTDEAFDIVETNDSGYAATGRYIEQGTFYSFLLKTDINGAVNFIKAYGDTNQYSCGYGLLALANGSYALCGATTIMKTNYQSYADEFLITINPNGDTLWCRTYHGTNPDGSENASSIINTSTGYAIAVATMSYPNVGFVPNKHVILRTDFSGNMTMVRSYNNGSSHYPYITKPFDGVGVLLSGFSTTYTSYFSPVMIRTDNNYESGCNETDLLAQTFMEYPPFQVRVPNLVSANGGSFVNSTVTALLTITDSVICENIVDTCNLAAAIHNMSTNVEFEISYNNINGDLNIVTKSNGVSILHIYDAAGRLIQNKSFRKNLNLNLKQNQQGLYFVSVSNEFFVAKSKIIVD